MMLEDSVELEENETLGACGCVDYHLADCNLGGAWLQDAPGDSDFDGPDGWGLDDAWA